MEDSFKGKIVFVAAISAGTYDLKSSPFSARYPGVEVHATALQNMLDARRVTPLGAGWRVAAMMLGCVAAAVGTVIPGRFPLKVLGGLAGAGLLILGGAFAARRQRVTPV
jgi:adenylate cyclase